MILTNAIKKHLEKILTQPPEDREISFYMDLLVSLASNPTINTLSNENISLQIIDRADTLIKKLMEKEQ